MKAAERADLDTTLLAAHASDDRPMLARLYTRAADFADADGDEGACAFFLTQAYVFALETGAPEADALHARLVSMGREE